MKYLAAAFAILLALLPALYAGRLVILATLAHAYLHYYGVEAAVAIERFDKQGLSGRAQLGTRAAPELSADHVELTFASDSRSILPRIGGIRVVRPRVRLLFDGQKLSFGALQPIVDFALARKTGGEPSISLEIEDAVLLLSTPAGPFEIGLDATANKGRGIVMNATLKPARIESADYTAQLKAASLSVAISSGIVNADASVIVGSVSVGGVNRLAANSVIVTLSLRGTKVVFDDSIVRGVASIKAKVTASNLQMAQLFAATVSASMDSFNCTLEASRRAQHFSGPTAATVDSAGVRASITSNKVRAPGLHAEFKGSVDIDQGRVDLRGALTGNGGIENGMELARRMPLASGAFDLGAAFARALTALQFEAQNFGAVWSNVESTIVLTTPIRVSSGNGVEAKLSQRMGKPLFAMRDNGIYGAFELRVLGGGLPAIDLAVATYSRSRSASGRSTVVADTELEGRWDNDRLHGLSVSVDGRLKIADGGVTFDLKRCASATLGSLMSGGHAQVSRVKSEFCEISGQPVFTLGSTAHWAVKAIWNASATADAETSDLRNATGWIRIYTGAEGLKKGRLEVTHAELSDLQSAARFVPLAITGGIVIAGDSESGNFTIADAAHAHKIASIAIRHSMKSASGGAVIDASNLHFEPSGLQPADLSPLLAGISRVTGDTSFHGNVDWSDGKVASTGLLTGSGIDGRSDIGVFKQASFKVQVDSFFPLIVPPGQSVMIRRIESAVPIEQFSARFSLSAGELRLEDLGAAAAEGRVTLDPTIIRLGSGGGASGILKMNDINLGKIVADSGLSEKVKLQARVNGALPFSVRSAELRVSNGLIVAAGPGRLSIRRDAWGGAVATGGEAAAHTVGVGPSGALTPPRNAIQDFAYQALEHLAFDQLEGAINSLPSGRIGLLFRIKGHNDPPSATETRVGIVDLLRGRAFDKPMSLPKGTQIDLTLDMSFDLDDLIAAYRNRKISLTSGSAVSAETQHNAAALKGTPP